MFPYARAVARVLPTAVVSFVYYLYVICDIRRPTEKRIQRTMRSVKRFFFFFFVRHHNSPQSYTPAVQRVFSSTKTPGEHNTRVCQQTSSRAIVNNETRRRRVQCRTFNVDFFVVPSPLFAAGAVTILAFDS